MLKNVMLLALACWLLSMPVHAAVIPPTAGPHTVSFSADQLTVRDKSTGYSAVVQVESRLTVGVLVGEPVYTCVASWRLLSVAAGDDGFDAGLTGASEGSFNASSLPPSVLKDVTLYDVDIAYPLAPGLPINSSSMLLCDAGILKAAGSDKPSFNFPSSPMWGELFWDDISDRHEGADRAKELYVEMLSAYEKRATKKRGAFSWGGSQADKWGSSVHSASINLWPVKSWLRKVVRDQAETARREAEVFEQKNTALVDQRGQVADDAFDALMTVVYRKEAAKQTVARFEERPAKKPVRAGVTREQMIADLPNNSCVDRERLAELNRDWEAGARMQETMGSCARARPEPAPYKPLGLKLQRVRY